MEFFSDHPTLMLHDFPGAKVVPQLFVSEKAPVIVIPVMSNVLSPRLSVTALPLRHRHPTLITFLHRKISWVVDKVAFAPPPPRN
jgi:hypothetical protein